MTTPTRNGSGPRPRSRLRHLAAGGTSAGLAAVVWYASTTFAGREEVDKLRDQVEALREKVHALDKAVDVLRIEARKPYE